MTMFEDDERFKALEREKDRRNIFEDHVSELKEKVLNDVYINELCCLKSNCIFVCPISSLYACIFDISFPLENFAQSSHLTFS